MFYQLQHPDGIASDFLHGWDCGLDRHRHCTEPPAGPTAFSPRGGGEPPQAKLLARLCSVVEVSEGKTDAHECGRQCQIFKTKNKSFENWKSEAICILPCLKSGIVGDFI